MAQHIRGHPNYTVLSEEVKNRNSYYDHFHFRQFPILTPSVSDNFQTLQKKWQKQTFDGTSKILRGTKWQLANRFGSSS